MEYGEARRRQHKDWHMNKNIYKRFKNQVAVLYKAETYNKSIKVNFADNHCDLVLPSWSVHAEKHKATASRME